MEKKPSTLDEIGKACGTDKSSWGHNYLSFYDQFLNPLRDRPLRLLEIGVAGGASLRMWATYFSKATIIGADITPEARRLSGGRIDVRIVDQSDPNQLTALGVEAGPFDIIIDDGSHMWSHQVLTMQALFPYLSPEGIFIEEDIHTSFPQLASGFCGDALYSCMDYLKGLGDMLVGGAILDQRMLNDPFLINWGTRIQFLALHRRTCLIQLGYRSNVEKRLVESLDDPIEHPVEFLAHVGGYGDRRVDSPFICGGSENQNIQGLALKLRTDKDLDFSYKVRSGERRWSSWAMRGEFVGSRGRSEDLTGVAVRLIGPTSDEYELQVAGAFRGVADPIVCMGGEECVSDAAPGSLWALQLVLRRR